MNREIIKTADGSNTLKIEGSLECFHSINGAYTESMHIFIQNGLLYYIDNILKEESNQVSHINILEIGFGTGLNSILTIVSAKEYPRTQINYNAIEKFPLSIEEFNSLNYKTLFANEWHSSIDKINTCNWDQNEKIENNFNLLKINCDIEILVDKTITLIDKKLADIVYFDAFSPNTQPQLWSIDIFRGVYRIMSDNSILVTYSAKGDVKRALREAGFSVTRKQGPPGKRHITVATKIVKEESF